MRVAIAWASFPAYARTIYTCVCVYVHDTSQCLLITTKTNNWSVCVFRYFFCCWLHENMTCVCIAKYTSEKTHISILRREIGNAISKMICLWTYAHRLKQYIYGRPRASTLQTKYCFLLKPNGYEQQHLAMCVCCFSYVYL